MDYIIKIDNREKDIIEKLEQRGYDLTKENLDLGDFQFIDLFSKEPILIIERKTYADLSASIKDGRYKEQKDRLLYSIKKSVRKIILLEGENLDKFSLPNKTLDGVIINTMVRDNMHIFLTKNKDETIDFIENIILHIPKYYDDLKKEIVNGEEKKGIQEFSSKSKKKDNITGSICFRNMLIQIPGISVKIAQVFEEKYKNMNNFICILKENNNSEKNKIIKSLAEERYGTTNRRVGDKVSEKIYEFIFN